VRIFTGAWCDEEAGQPVVRVLVRYADQSFDVYTFGPGQLQEEILLVHPLARAANEWARACLQGCFGYDARKECAVLAILGRSGFGLDFVTRDADGRIRVRCANREGMPELVYRLATRIADYVCDEAKRVWTRVVEDGAP
jgi:pimeloyl-ACP methyl ester carboxylesterase